MAIANTPNLKLKRFDVDEPLINTDVNSNMDKIDVGTFNGGNAGHGNMSVPFNSSGVGTLNHNLGWVPSVILVSARLSSSLISVAVNIDINPTTTTASLRAWRADGSAYTANLSKVDWVAFK